MNYKVIALEQVWYPSWIPPLLDTLYSNFCAIINGKIPPADFAVIKIIKETNCEKNNKEICRRIKKCHASVIDLLVMKVDEAATQFTFTFVRGNKGSFETNELNLLLSGLEFDPHDPKARYCAIEWMWLSQKPRTLELERMGIGSEFRRHGLAKSIVHSSIKNLFQVFPSITTISIQCEHFGMLRMFLSDHATAFRDLYHPETSEVRALYGIDAIKQVLPTPDEQKRNSLIFRFPGTTVTVEDSCISPMVIVIHTLTS